MKNLEFNGLQELTVNEMRDLNGGVICGGICMAIVIALVLSTCTQKLH